jgi:hypothetical protein
MSLYPLETLKEVISTRFEFDTVHMKTLLTCFMKASNNDIEMK